MQPALDAHRTFETVVQLTVLCCLQAPKPLRLPDERQGAEILHDPFFNKGTAFPSRERDRLGLRGLLPVGRLTLKEQLQRSYLAFHRAGGTTPGSPKSKDTHEGLVAKHLFLVSLQDRNETLFYRLLVDHIEEMAPIIYTPIVGYGAAVFAVWRLRFIPRLCAQPA